MDIKNKSGVVIFAVPGADLENARLIGADLENASLSDADLENADLSDADLRTANLSGAAGDEIGEKINPWTKD